MRRRGGATVKVPSLPLPLAQLCVSLGSLRVSRHPPLGSPHSPFSVMFWPESVSLPFKSTDNAEQSRHAASKTAGSKC